MNFSVKWTSSPDGLLVGRTFPWSGPLLEVNICLELTSPQSEILLGFDFSLSVNMS